MFVKIKKFLVVITIKQLNSAYIGQEIGWNILPRSVNSGTKAFDPSKFQRFIEKTEIFQFMPKPSSFLFLIKVVLRIFAGLWFQMKANVC